MMMRRRRRRKRKEGGCLYACINDLLSLPA
jgi:hypothetical protein